MIFQRSLKQLTGFPGTKLHTGTRLISTWTQKNHDKKKKILFPYLPQLLILKQKHVSQQMLQTPESIKKIVFVWRRGGEVKDLEVVT